MTTNFCIIGGGWRTEFFMRIARELPERFRVTGVLVRDAEKAAKFRAKWNVPTFPDLDSLLPAGGDRPAFALTSVPWAITPDLIRELVSRNLPVLAETPPAPDQGALNSLWYDVGRTGRVQVAEQYAFQPMIAARLNIARSGKLGTVTQAQISSAHGYHGVSVLRRALGIEFENATIQATKFASPIVAGPGRDGPPSSETIHSASQIIATLHFDGKLGVFDFTGEQYFSYIRSNRCLIRGDRGEINNDTVRYLKDFRTPIIGELRRADAGGEGNLEGLFHKGVLLGDEWAFTNPFPYARLSDDEIAIALLLDGMGKYADGGPDIYSLADASQDHYLGLCIDRAAARRRTRQNEVTGMDVSPLPFHIEPFTGFQIAVYPAGATFGPRRLNDYEFVWMLEGDAEYRWNETVVEAREGSLLLCRPPATDAFRWDKLRRTRHAYFHFRWRGDLPETWPAPADWPLMRPASETNSLLAPLFRHLLSANERSDAILTQCLTLSLLAAYVTGETPSHDTPTNALPEPVMRVLAHIQIRLDEAPEEKISLPDLAAIACVTPEHLCRLFRRATGHTPAATVRRARLDRAFTLLTRTNYSIAEVAALSGFENPFHFSRQFKARFGHSPRQARIKA